MAKVVSNLASELHGSIGNVTFVEGPDGTYIRPRTIPHNPRTPAQSRVRYGMAAATTLYHALTSAELLAWQAYANALPPQLNADGYVRKFRAYDLFTKLTLKYLQVTPTGTPPPGEIIFTATAANAPEVVTELLLQPLASVVRAPAARGYRSQEFIAFAAGPLAVGLSVAAGVYVPAYRFVHVPTGQDTPLVPLPVLEVG